MTHASFEKGTQGIEAKIALKPTSLTALKQSQDDFYDSFKIWLKPKSNHIFLGSVSETIVNGSLDDSRKFFV